MRLHWSSCWLLPLLVAAACSSSSSKPADMSSSGPDMTTLSCPQTLDAYCTPAAGCVRDATTAVQLSSWCSDGGTATSAQSLGCTGGDQVVIVQYSDSAITFFYSGGMLVAVFTAVPHSQQLVCLAGPAQTAPPVGCSVPLDLCSP